MKTLILSKKRFLEEKQFSKLSRCSWESLKAFSRKPCRKRMLCLVPSLPYPDKSGFRVAPSFDTKDLEKIFRHNVFKILLSKGKITRELVDMRFDMLTALS
jgi:hypothetical protein